MAAPDTETEPEKPGIIDRMRARYRWFDHVMRAQDRYQDSKGDFYAAGITYFTVFALFPLLMVGFAVGGFILVRQPDLLAQVEDRILSADGTRVVVQAFVLEVQDGPGVAHGATE